MKEDDVIRMAREAHKKLVTEVYVGHMGKLNPWMMEFSYIFAELVAQEVRDRIMFGSRDDWVLAEREACAKVCESYVAQGIGREMARAIRARGEQA